MKKIVIILIILLSLIFTGLAIYAYSRNDKSPIVKISPLPTPKPETGETVTIPSASGNITVNNFYKNSKIIETSVFLTDQPNFSIIYFSNENEFLISLNARTEEEALATRTQAEDTLKLLLGTTEKNMCQLTIKVQIPVSYNQELSNKDYGLSFCTKGNASDINNVGDGNIR